MMAAGLRMHRRGPKLPLACLLVILTPSSMVSGAQLVYAVGAGSAPMNLPNIEGGYLSDRVAGMAVDSRGYVYIAGKTYSPA